MCSIDNMPTQLPTEATDFFGNLMMPYALDIIKSDATKPLLESDFKPSVYGVRIILISCLGCLLRPITLSARYVNFY